MLIPSLVVAYWMGGGSMTSGQSIVAGVTGRLGAVGQAGLREDVTDVTLHGVDADDEVFGNLRVGTSGGDQAQDLDLARRKAASGWRHWRIGLDFGEKGLDCAHSLFGVTPGVGAV